MASGTNPNSRANLVQFSGRSRNEVEQIQAEGGRRSGVTRRKFKTFREELKQELTADRGAKVIDRLISMAENGNINAIKLMLQILGEDSAKKIEVAGSDGKPFEFVWVGEEKQ